MTISNSQKQAVLKYKASKIKRIPLDVQIEKYNEIKLQADKNGETINGYIKKAIDLRMSQENSTN